MNEEDHKRYSTMTDDELRDEFDGLELECRAWDLVGVFSPLLDHTHEAFIPNGRVAYHGAATVRGNDSVRLSRIVNGNRNPNATFDIRQINRYVDWKQKIVLRPIAGGE